MKEFLIKWFFRSLIALTLFIVGSIANSFRKGWETKELTDAYIDARASLVWDAKAAPHIARRDVINESVDHRLENLERQGIDNAKALGRIEGKLNELTEE